MALPEKSISSTLNLIHKHGKLQNLKEDIYLTTTSIDFDNPYVDEDLLFEKYHKGDILELYNDPPTIKYDEDCIGIYHDKEKVGYLYAGINTITSNLLKAGKSLYGEVEKVDYNEIGKLEVYFKLYLIR